MENHENICPFLCECKKSKGRKLYDIYTSWLENEDNKPFDDLTEVEQIAWIMASNWKKKPQLPPAMDNLFKGFDMDNEIEDEHDDTPTETPKGKKKVKAKKNKKDPTDTEVEDKVIKTARKKLENIKKEKKKIEQQLSA